MDLESPEQKQKRMASSPPARTIRRFGNWKPFKLTPPTFATAAFSATPPTSPHANAAARSRSSALETRSPRVTLNVDNVNELSFKATHRKPRGEELLYRLNSQCLKVSLRRTILLRERKSKIRARLDTIKHRAFLQKHRHNLKLLRFRVRHDFTMSAAYLKRQLILQQKAELWGAAVERAQNVALLNRLRKCIRLRRAYSERLAKLLHEARSEGELDETSFTSTTRRHKRSFLRSTANQIFAPTRPILSLPDSAFFSMSSLDGPQDSSSDEHFDGALSPVSSCPSPCSTEEAVLELSVFAKPEEEDDESDDDLEAEELKFSRWRPPINRDTLAELDLEEMRTNVQLRHDLLFDPNLQFRPNVAGEPGAAKKARWEQYWEMLHLELEGDPSKHDGTEPSNPEPARRTSLVPILIWEAREIMLMLFVLDEDVRQELFAKMDVSLIAQELEHNAFDVAGFVTWLACMLKTHCSPERQEATDDIVDAVKAGKFASAFRLLFELLEIMKLDIANDQLCNVFRPYVLKHAVEFEWRHFELQLEAGITTLDGTTAWLAQGMARNPDQNFDETFYDCIVQLVATSTSDRALPGPETLHMDGSRLHCFHNDFQDISIMATILLLFRQLAGSRCAFNDVMETKSALWTLLVEVGTTMQHITSQILHSAEKVRQHPFSQSERTLMSNLVDKTLSADSKVFQLVQTRVSKVLKDFLCEQRKKSVGATNQMVPAESKSQRFDSDAAPAADSALNEAVLRKYGLLELEGGILDLAERIQQLTEHNRAVHITVYQSIWSSLQEGDQNGLSAILARK